MRDRKMHGALPQAFALGFLTLWAIGCSTPSVAQVSQPFICDTPTSKGAVVDDSRRCQFFRRFLPNYGSVDNRIAKNLKLGPADHARSIALIVGISKYRNHEFDSPAAAVDVENLKEFLMNSQNFDEVISLEDKDATIESIRYFLRTYVIDRSMDYNGKVRFLFAYTGHGVQSQAIGYARQPAAGTPFVGFALSEAADATDYTNIYDINEITGLFYNISKDTYQFIALINACYGGAVFNEARQPGATLMNGQGSWAITAGPDDMEVQSTANGKGSVFFDALIKGIDSGEADPDGRAATLNLPGSTQELAGIVRISTIDAYLQKAILNEITLNPDAAASLEANSLHWMGPIEPVNVRTDGGFFFFQHPRRPPSPGTPIGASAPPPGASAIPYNEALQTSSMFTPSLNQMVSAAVHNGADGFDNLRSATKAVRGIDVSHYNGTIDWGKVSHNNVQFAYIKATQSTTYIDNTFEKNWEGAKDAGVSRGAYHVFSFCRDVQAQFENIAKHVPQDDSALPIALDLLLVEGQETSQFKWQADEGKCAITLRPDGIRDRIKDLSQLIASKYGRQPILYGGNYILDDILSKSFTDGFTLWRGTPGIAQSPPPPWSIWQYSTNESVPGINEPVDVDVLSAKGG